MLGYEWKTWVFQAVPGRTPCYQVRDRVTLCMDRRTACELLKRISEGLLAVEDGTRGKLEITLGGALRPEGEEPTSRPLDHPAEAGRSRVDFPARVD
jgi:hypothetical protein